MKKKIAEIALAAVLTLQLSATVFAGTYYTKDILRVRSAPSTDSETIDTLPKNSKLEVIETKDGWARVKMHDRTCYVKAEFLSSEPSSSEAVYNAGSSSSNQTASNGNSNQTASSGNGSSNQSASAGGSGSASNGEAVGLDPAWKYADFSAIHSGSAVMYRASGNRKGKVIGVNAGHGTSGGGSVKTWCHPDQTPKVTGGSTGAGATKATAVAAGMDFKDGTPEAKVTLKEARIFRDMLLAEGYDVLMIRDGDDVQLDNVARTVICNNMADCHIAIHWDGDGLSYDKGCFFMSVPDKLKYLPSVASTWQESERLGENLISGLSSAGNKIMGGGSMDLDLTQTSYSTVPSVDIELGNQSSDHSEEKLNQLARGLVYGVNAFFGY